MRQGVVVAILAMVGLLARGAGATPPLPDLTFEVE